MVQPKVKTDDIYAWGAGLLAATVTIILLVVFVVLPYNNVPGPRNPNGPVPIIGRESNAPSPKVIRPGQTSVTVPGKSGQTAAVPSKAPGGSVGSGKGKGSTTTPVQPGRPSPTPSGPGRTTPSPVKTTPPLIDVNLPPLIPGVTLPPIKIPGLIGISQHP